ncbi:MAG: AAA family ATPase, partial [Nitrososphaera sp.]
MVHDVVNKLGGLGLQHCPGPNHTRGDYRPSLSVTEAEDKVLLYCHAGCSIEDVCAAIGCRVSDLFTDNRGQLAAYYVYTDEHGEPLYRVVRLQPKAFSQDRYDNGKWKPGLRNVRRVLYHLPEVIANDEIYVVEGEKDADTLAPEYVACATTFPGGARSWDDSYLEFLEGKRVTVVGDNDAAGRKRAGMLASRLDGRADTIVVVYPQRDCKDATEHILAGYGVADFTPYSTVAGRFLDMSSQPPAIDWLFRRVLPKGALVLFWGSTATAKSMVTLAIMKTLGDEGLVSTFYNEEMPEELVRSRFAELQCSSKVRVVSGQGLDLSDENEVDRIIEECRGTALLAFDSYNIIYAPGTEKHPNEKFVEFSKHARRIINETGTTLIMIDHSGFEATHERDASAKRQQVDVSVQFEDTNQDWKGKGHPAKFRMVNRKSVRYSNPFRYEGCVWDDGPYIRVSFAGFVPPNQGGEDVGPRDEVD